MCPCYCLPECSGSVCTRLNGVRMASHLQSCQMHLNTLPNQQACTRPPALLLLMLKLIVDEVNLPCKTLRSSQDQHVLSLLSEKENTPILKKKTNKGSNHDHLKENTTHNNLTSWGHKRNIHSLENSFIFSACCCERKAVSAGGYYTIAGVGVLFYLNCRRCGS